MMQGAQFIKETLVPQRRAFGIIAKAQGRVWYCGCQGTRPGGANWRNGEIVGWITHPRFWRNRENGGHATRQNTPKAVFLKAQLSSRLQIAQVILRPLPPYGPLPSIPDNPASNIVASA